MSNRILSIPTDIECCDWCDKPMDIYDATDGTRYEPIKASIVSGYISPPTSDKRVNKFYFFWKRHEEKKRPVRYDFHSRCFDIMVKKALATKNGASE